MSDYVMLYVWNYIPKREKAPTHNQDFLGNTFNYRLVKE